MDQRRLPVGLWIRALAIGSKGKLHLGLISNDSTSGAKHFSPCEESHSPQSKFRNGLEQGPQSSPNWPPDFDAPKSMEIITIS